MYKTFQFVPVLAATIAISNPVWSGDARSIALGGSAIANAKGAHGALENPASMMEMQRAGQRIHFRLGFSAEVRDTGDALSTLTDTANNNLLSDIEAQIDELSNRQIMCDPLSGDAAQVCVDNTLDLSILANRLLDVVNTIDNETIDIQASADIGMAFTQATYPVAISVKATVTGSGTPDIVESDIDYVTEFASLLDNNTLTLGEISNSTYLEANALGIPLGVVLPEDILESEGTGTTVIRTQIGVGFATAMTLGDMTIDAGITPKFSSLTAYSLKASVVAELDDTVDSIGDRFEDSEVVDNTYTFDIGVSAELSNLPIRIAGVVKNVIPESIETEEGFVFETTPQLIIGAALKKQHFTLTGDFAMNKAKQDNFESQKMALGVEFEFKKLALRGGVSHDGGRKSDTTALSLGLGLGPIQIGARVSENNAMEGSAQLSYSF